MWRAGLKVIEFASIKTSLFRSDYTTQIFALPYYSHLTAFWKRFVTHIFVGDWYNWDKYWSTFTVYMACGIRYKFWIVITICFRLMILQSIEHVYCMIWIWQFKEMYPLNDSLYIYIHFWQTVSNIWTPYVLYSICRYAIGVCKYNNYSISLWIKKIFFSKYDTIYQIEIKLLIYCLFWHKHTMGSNIF